jgi:parallel beta-helix repeat protein
MRRPSLFLPVSVVLALLLISLAAKPMSAAHTSRQELTPGSARQGPPSLGLQETTEASQAPAALQVDPAPVPLRVFIYDDYEESNYDGSLREYLEARGHDVTYSHDDMGNIDVWARYSDYDVVLAIHTVGSGTLTNLSSWLQNGRGYVAMLGWGMWNDAEDTYIRGLLGVNDSGYAGEGWTPDQLTWTDPAHPLGHVPNDGWNITQIPTGQNQFYIDITGGHTIVSGPDGAVIQSREAVEGAARVLVLGTNYHDQDRSDAEARYLVENALAWAANPRPLAWFQPASTSAVDSPGSTVSHSLHLVNRTAVATAFNLSVTGNAWPTAFYDTLGNPITSVGPLAPNAGADVVVKVQIPGAATTSAMDTATVHATPVNPAGQAASAQLTTSAPGPAYRVRMTSNAFQVPAIGSTNVTAHVTDRDGVPVVNGTPVNFTVIGRGSVLPVVANTSGGRATTTFFGGSTCGLGEIRAQTGGVWAVTDISVATSGPVELASGAHIAADTTWTACAGPYIVHGALTVDPGAALTVMAGTQARFDPGGALIVLGTLNVLGEKNARVAFAANDGDPDRWYWQGLIFGDAAHEGAGQVAYATVSAGQWHDYEGGRYGADILVYNGAPAILSSVFQRGGGAGIWATARSAPTIVDNQIFDSDMGIIVESASLIATDVPIPSGSQADVPWRVTAFGEPAAGWQSNLSFDDSGWSEMLTPICDDSGCKTNLDLEGDTLYARKVIEPAFPQTTTYYVRSMRDDVVTIWVNGALVYADTSGGGAQWTQRIPVHLVPGPNLIAAKLEDPGRGANYFDLELAGGMLSQPRVTDNVILRTYYGGLGIQSSSPIVARNEIANCGGDGIWIEGDGSPIVRNNRIHHNAGNGVDFSYNWPGGTPSIYNNTIDSHGLYGLFWARDWNDQPDIQNNIVTGNGVGGIRCRRTHPSTVAYNDAWSNPVDYDEPEVGWCGGTGNIQLDPLFVGAGHADYRLQAGSPAIDAGNPAPAFNDMDGSRNDMGAYGGPIGPFNTWLPAVLR